MRKILAFLLIVFMPALIAAQSKSLVFTHVTVVDTTGAPSRSNITVIVSGDRIVALGKTGKIPIPENSQVIDATGKFMIPGLWDMHWHTPGDKQTREIFVPLTIANGVTGVRNMWGTEAALKLRADIRGGALLGLRMIIGSAPVDGRTPMWPGSISVADAGAGKQSVFSIKKNGYDFVKVYQFLSREAYLAIAGEAKKQNIPFAGHVPFSMTAAEASDAGQKSFEHLFGINLACSADEATLRPILAGAAANVDKAFAPHIDLFIRNESEPLAGYSDRKCAALFKTFVKNETYIVPTLVLHRALGLGADPNFRNDPRLKYMPPDIRASFDWELGFFKAYRPVYEHFLITVGALNRAGVKILAGTDTYNSYCFPGFSLHDELALLVDAGLSPLEALQTATVNPAKYFGTSETMGTLEKGKTADIVLLDANPLENIGNTKKIAAVVVNGKYLSKESLQKILADVEAAANRK